MQGNIVARSNNQVIQSWTTHTTCVRVEFVRCRTNATVEWSVAKREVSMLWVRNGSGEARIRMADGQIHRTRSTKPNLWFFPEGMDARGELEAESDYDCVGVFVDPAFVPATVKPALSVPLSGVCNETLGHVFNALAGEGGKPDDVLPFFTEGWAMQTLAHVARAATERQRRSEAGISRLAPWQLRRAQAMLRADLSGRRLRGSVAEACKLSVSHFSRAFRASTSVPPHRWLTAARIETARHLLANSWTPLAEVADICGFADQSHFSRIFGRAVGKSPGAWRREHRT